MIPPSDPFIIKESGGSIKDRAVKGFSWRAFEGTSIGEPGVGTLRRVITQTVPYVWLSLMAVILLVFLSRLAYLQLVQGKYWRSIAEGNRIRLQYLSAPRGQIVDRQNRPLTQNTPSFSLIVVPADMPSDENERQVLLNDLLAAVPPELIHQEEINNLSAASYLPQVIASNIPRDLALQLLVKTAGTRGVSIDIINQREYLLGEAAAHLIGYIGRISSTEYEARRNGYLLNDLIGKSGIELSYEGVLRGVTGRKQVEVDAFGRERKVYATQVAQAGAKLMLTIDSDLQEFAYQQLKLVAGRGGQGGSIVALDPRTGEILALVSYPSFDPNIFTVKRDNKLIKAALSGERQLMYNRAIGGEYPPGSTIKPIIAAAGLADGVITATTTVLSSGGIQLGDQFFADWKEGGHGLTDVYKAIAESVNTFFYLLGGGGDRLIGLGISRLDYYFNLFGFGHKTNIDLPGEKDGLVPSPEWKGRTYGDRWYRGDTYNVSIGQGNLLVTPLQMAVAYAALVNSSTIYWPHLVQEITFADGKVDKMAPRVLANLDIKAEVWQIIKDSLRRTVTGGSARSLQLVAEPVAGKTGTAQTGAKTAPHAWFAGYIPATDPGMVVVVMLENGGEGSTMAVPIAHELFNWYYNKHN